MPRRRKTNVAGSILAGLLGGAGQYLAQRSKQAEEEKDFERRMRYMTEREDYQEGLRQEREAKIQQKKEAGISSTYSTLNEFLTPQANIFEFVPGGGELKGGLTPNKTADPFATGGRSDFLGKLSKLKALDQTYNTDAAKVFEAEYKRLHPDADYGEKFNEDTGQMVRYNKNNPLQKKVFDFPELKKKEKPDIQLLGGGPESPFIVEYNKTTGETKKIKNPNYKGRRMVQLEDDIIVDYNYDTGEMKVTKDERLKGLNKKRSEAEKLIEKDYLEVIKDEAKAQEAMFIGAEAVAIDKKSDTAIPMDDFKSSLAQRRGALMENIKIHMGTKAEVFDKNWNDYQVNLKQDPAEATLQFMDNFWNDAVQAYTNGELEEEDLRNSEKLFYLQFGVTPSDYLGKKLENQAKTQMIEKLKTLNLGTIQGF